MNKKIIALVLGIVCLLLTAGIVIQIKTINKTTSGISTLLTDNDLRDQVLEWKGKYDSSFSSLERAQKDLEKIRAEAAKDTEGYEEKEQIMKKYNNVLGLTDVEGEGVIVSLKDNTAVTADTISITDDISYYLVHDVDLRSLINELENSGAEAISINDERIVSTTSITCEGTVINVNGNKVSSPFTIKAIGPAFKMYSALLRPGGYVEGLNTTGINTTVKQEQKVFINKYSGVVSAKIMEYID